MESLEISAKTVEEAIERALEQLGVSREAVNIEILSKGKSGILGLGAEDARVRVTVLSQAPSGRAEVIQQAEETLVQLLARMGTEANVEVEESQGGAEEIGSVVLNITGDDLGILIGRRGETLSSLQYIVNLMVSRRLKARAGVTVDVEGYRARRYQSLRDLATRMAERVKETGRSVTLEPMPSAERRIVHLTLQDTPDIVTQSIGDGESRKVVIYLKKRQ